MTVRDTIRARPRLRLMAWGALLALLASACSGGDEPASTATIAPPAPTEAPPADVDPTSPPETDPWEMIDTALGGGQAVQDFVIYVDMARYSGADPVSFYDSVIEVARSGASTEMDLGGGFTFAPTALVGDVRDSRDEPLPTLSVDFGLLTTDRRRLQAAQSESSEVLAAVGLTDVAELVEADPLQDSTVLIKIITADFGERRAHLGPGDRSTIDLSAVDAIEPGDDVGVAFLFGQTLPGDPEEERGLGPQALFAYRWKQGQIAVLGGPAGPAVSFDSTVEVVEGSTILTQEDKQSVLGRLTFLGYLAGMGEAFDVLSRAREQLAATGDYQSVEGAPGIAAANGRIVLIWEEVYEDGAYSQREAVLTPGEFIGAWSLRRALDLCKAAAQEMNRRNQRGGMTAADLEGMLTGEAEDDDATSGTADDTEGEETPPPLGCNEPGGGPPEPPRFPTGTVYGDVHLRTMDGHPYENQATGEFVLFDDGSASVQVRLEPVPGRSSVSIATAVAIRIGEATVSMHLDGRTWIDGRLADLPRGEAVSVGGGSLLRWLEGWVAVWPDGTVARVQNVATTLNLGLTVRSATSVGLLGNNDGDPDNDFVTRSGTLLPPDADDDFASFYAPGGFVDSWRIMPDESLFHYEPGETNEAFIVAGFPAGPSELEDIPFDDRSRAEEVCASAGVAHPEVLEDCVLDVALTGNPGLAYASFIAQTMAPRPGPEVPDDDAPAVSRPSVEGGSIVVFGGTTIEFGPDPPIQDPSGIRPRWQCTVEDGSFFATSRFAETATRQFEIEIRYLDGSASGTGEPRFSITVKLNYEDYAWALSYDAAFSDVQAELQGNTLVASGSGFLNEPLDTRLHPIVALPDDAALTPFLLEATCGS